MKGNLVQVFLSFLEREEGDFQGLSKVRYKHLNVRTLAVLKCHRCFLYSDHFAGIWQHLYHVDAYLN
ncbi:hypothetical protein BRADI_2g54183v3 [Brachypodium distachyon]|uniref:Uncharacterized protein n=1 Tax=Brachypodium distachyon TaxID=15368 RepID=A0A2K2DFU6_BRADI|nr:hypothetical protein BRADI_2g54183v3 [Brachypodium distachyon]